MNTRNRIKNLASTTCVLLDDYISISKRRRAGDGRLFRARVLNDGTLCVGGDEARRLLADRERFSREPGADGAPLRVRQAFEWRGFSFPEGARVRLEAPVQEGAAPRVSRQEAAAPEASQEAAAPEASQEATGSEASRAKTRRALAAA